MSEDSEQQPGAEPTPPPYPPTYPPTYPPAYPTSGPTNPYAAGYTPPPPGWTPQPGMPAFPVYAVRDLPKATTAMVLGIIAIAGAFTCLLPVLIAPVAWVLGAQARREIRSAPQQWGGEGKATAGMVLGIIGTVLLVLGVVAIVILIAVAVNDPTAFDSDTGV